MDTSLSRGSAANDLMAQGWYKGQAGSVTYREDRDGHQGKERPQEFGHQEEQERDWGSIMECHKALWGSLLFSLGAKSLW